MTKHNCCTSPSSLLFAKSPLFTFYASTCSTPPLPSQRNNTSIATERTEQCSVTRRSSHLLRCCGAEQTRWVRNSTTLRVRHKATGRATRQHDARQAKTWKPQTVPFVRIRRTTTTTTAVLGNCRGCQSCQARVRVPLFDLANVRLLDRSSCTHHSLAVCCIHPSLSSLPSGVCAVSQSSRVFKRPRFVASESSSHGFGRS